MKIRSYYADPNQWFDFTGVAPAPPIDPNSSEFLVWDGGADTAALKAWSSWGEGKIAYSDALRHAGETAKMVGNLAKGVANGVDGLMTEKYGKNVRNVMSKWKKLPEWYLQYLYGWKPLADDIENAVDQLSEQFDEGNSYHVILKGSWKGRREIQYKVTCGGITIGWEVVYTVLLQQKNRAVFRYDIPKTGLANVQPTGFFGTLWEGSKGSFVLDWLVPVGTYLSALEANALAPYFTEGCVSEVVKVISTSGKVEPVGGWSIVTTGGAPSMRLHPFRFRRVLKGPYTVSTRPPIRNPLNLQHAAQGLALLSQVMKKWY